MAAILIFLHGVAAAHVPHDTVASVALPSTLDASGRWVVLVSAHLPLLEARNNDGIFEIIGGEPMGDAPVATAQLADGTVVLVGATELWWSEEGLASWTHAPLPGAVTSAVADGDEIVLAGEGGVWAGLPWAMEMIFDEPASFLSNGGAVAVVGGGGEVWRRDGAEWTELGTVPEATSVLATADATFVGTREGTVLRWEGESWAACGSLSTEGAAHGDVVVLAVDLLDSTVLYVGTGIDAPYRSDDGCASFEPRFGTSNIQWDGEGSPEDAHEAVSAIAAYGDTVVVAGWMGLFLSNDAGNSWTPTSLLPADYLRGLAAAAGADGEPVVVEGPYASGPIRTADGGATWTGQNTGLVDDNVQEVAVDPLDADRLYAVVGHDGFVSGDGGASWTATDPADVGQFDVDEQEAGSAWAGGRDGVLVTHDAGATWTALTDLPATGHFVAHAGLADGSDCIATTSPTEVWCQSGRTWSLSFAAEERAIGLAGTATGLVLATEAGAVRWDGGSAEVTLGPLVADHIVSFTASGTGVLFAGTAAGLVIRSPDEGATWATWTFRFPAPVWSLAPLPAFIVRNQLLVGTLDGAFIVDGAGSEDVSVATISRWAPEQRVDDASHFLVREGCPDSAAGDGYALDTRTLMIPHCSLQTTLRGDVLRVYGTSAGTARADLLVDGEVVAHLGGQAVAEPGLLAGIEMGPGWHRVDLVGISGEGLFLDAVEANDTPLADTGEGPGDSEVRPEPECECAAGGGEGTFVALLMGAVVVGGRRQGGGRSAAQRPNTKDSPTRL